MPRISIITPCYNAAPYVARMIQSVRAQTFTDWEHIIVDDGSKDCSASVIEERMEQEPRLKLVRQPNRGVCSARNNGVRHSAAESEYLYFLDADDLLDPAMLATMAAYLDAHPAVGLAFCDYLAIDPEDRILPTTYFPRHIPSRFGVRALPPTEPRTPFVSVYCWAPVMESLAVLRRSVYARTPGWDESFGQHGEGIDLFLHFALLSEVHFVPQKLYHYRRHGAQSTADLSKHWIQEKKVCAKWAQMPGLTPEQQTLVRAAQRFRESRLIPCIGVHAGTQHLRHGRYGLATRFYLGAMRRYLMPYLPFLRWERD